MKLLNQSITLISGSIFVIIGIWAIVFYFHLIGEIKESVDEGLNNYRGQIIYQAHQDTVLLKQVDFKEGFYAIQKIPKEEAFKVKDTYSDTLMHIPKGRKNKMELEPFRILTTAFEDDGLYYRLQVISPLVEKDELIEQLLKTTLWLYAALIVSILFINNYVLRRVWHPFYAFLTQLKNYRIGSTDKLPQVKTHTREFIDLQKATNILLQHNLRTFNQQKEFIGNASHELQTPLAIARNKMELLLEKAELREDQAEDLGQVMQIIERLIRLNKSLLLLTKIENNQFLKISSVSINQLLRDGILELQEILDYKGLECSLIEKAQLTLNLNPALAEILFHNLLRNAVFHSEEKNQLKIEVFSDNLIISNQGTKALDPQKLFNRFHKSSQSTKGSGLGLSIAKAICNLYGYDLTYQFKNGWHSFHLNFNAEKNRN